VFCGHEYTVNNLKYSLHAEPGNEDSQRKLEWAESERALRRPTVPSTIAEEKKFNPFMRVIVPALQQRVGAKDAVSCMGTLRRMKDDFKC
jgi:hydroxyacylglutathione hydrolase